VRGFLESLIPELEAFRFDRYGHAETRSFDLRANWKLVVDVNFEGYHFPYLHRNTLAHFCTNNSAFDTFGPHCRWAFPFREIADLADVPEVDWPERFTGTVVYGVFPSCVLIESPYSTQMLRIYPGRAPGDARVFLAGGAFEPIADDDHLERVKAGLEGACEVLRDEDFPAAESCQQGIESGLPSVVLGRAEALLQHFHRVWDAHVATAEGATQ
jgi:phenylpropionate dioxygenase-like ring-hydroxylating dioxygenase large terminal subunit